MRTVAVMSTALVAAVTVGMAAPPAEANGVHERGADRARAEAWGVNARGAADAGPMPEPAVAEAPPGEADRDAQAAGRVDRGPATVGTLRGEAEVHKRRRHRARLVDVVADASAVSPPPRWTARGHAIAQEAAVLFDGGEGPQLSAEAVEAEALAACDFGDRHFATAARVQQLEFGGDELPVLGDALDAATELVMAGEPNGDVLAATPGGEQLAELGLEITAWETNWDGADGTTDGGDTVWVNALRVSVVEGSRLAEAVGAQDVAVAHSQASVDCAPPLHPLIIGADASTDTVAPGDVFTYTVTVANENPECTAEDVSVTGHIDGPAGSQIAATDPPADTDRLSVRWEGLEPLPAGEQLTATVDVAVPDDAADGAVYDVFASVGGSCDGLPVDSRTLRDGPRVVAGSGDRVETAGSGGSAGPTDADPGAADAQPAGAGEGLPATGGGAAGLGAALVLGGALIAALRRVLRSRGA